MPDTGKCNFLEYPDVQFCWSTGRTDAHARNQTPQTAWLTSLQRKALAHNIVFKAVRSLEPAIGVTTLSVSKRSLT